MKPDYWMRLADAARQAPLAPPPDVPFGFDTRVLVEWRSPRDGEGILPWALLLRGALVCASLIMLLSVAMNYQTLREREPGSVAIADSVLRMSMLP
jgi:hypothetical protein